MRVLIVDDQPTFREAAGELITATAGFEWVGSAGSGEEGVEQAVRLRPDLVLMDVRMPGIGGIEAARRITALGLPTIVVLITAEESVRRIPDGTAAELVSKSKLTRQLVTRLWEEHRRPAARAVAGA